MTEPRSDTEIRADLAYTRSYPSATLLNAPGPCLRLVADVEPLLARVSELEQENERLTDLIAEFRKRDETATRVIAELRQSAAGSMLPYRRAVARAERAEAQIRAIRAETLPPEKPSAVLLATVTERLEAARATHHGQRADGLAVALEIVAGLAGIPPEATPAERKACDGFRWIGQTFASCDDCGQPYWEHTHSREIDRERAFDVGFNYELVPITPEQADAARRRWCPTCSGPIRETVGMVCQTCGTDYGVTP